ncbi:MAG: phosphoenolpyruvate--protein phosphotransferase, partial [Deltaproteobacteria bacterium]|nr:phosphoenolpyruvate--protein phosphotransferase [Deltaproteobacteria bacterium]
TLTRALRDGLGEATVAVARPRAAEAPVPVSDSGDACLVHGVAASPGLAVGRLRRKQGRVFDVSEQGQGEAKELGRLDAALDRARQEIGALRTGVGKKAEAGIFAAHLELLEDPELLNRVREGIGQGRSAAFAWQEAYTAHADLLAGLRNDLLAQRADDLRDVGERVLGFLTGTARVQRAYSPESILVSRDLTPSDMAELDTKNIVGLCTVAGGATSHVAILARSMGLPMMAGCGPRLLDLPEETPAILDAAGGCLRLDPTEREMGEHRHKMAENRARREMELSAKDEPAVTVDGIRIEVAGNIGGVEEAEKCAAMGGDGVGLMRTEFVFMGRDTAPDEDEQAAIYTKVLQAMGPDRPVVIRTMDVGGDKPLAYLPMDPEDNPFLGERGIRVGLVRPELLRTQIRAILQASAHGQPLVMFPMISRLEEFRQARAMVDEERERLGVEPIPVGIMVETPAAALLAEQFAREADFFSVGTNDLTQYTLAMDRGHAKLAAHCDGLDPAVLTLIHRAAQAATAQGKWCGICGGLAGDAQAVPILIGLGVRELSVGLASIPTVKAQVRTLSLSRCRELASRALTLDSAARVRELCLKGCGKGF